MKEEGLQVISSHWNDLSISLANLMLSHWVICVLRIPKFSFPLNFCACCCWSLMWHCIFLTGEICNCVAQISKLLCVLFEQLTLCFLSGNQVHRFYRKFGAHPPWSAVWLLLCTEEWTCEPLAKTHLAFFFFFFYYYIEFPKSKSLWKLGQDVWVFPVKSERGLARSFC